MSSQVVKVLRQGVWGSLTGGWYYDPHFSNFTNVFHLYTWLILMCLPFIFFMVPASVSPWGMVCTYAACVFAIFAGIKITNYRLHAMFDEGNVVDRKVIPVKNDDQAIAIDELVSDENRGHSDSQPTSTVLTPGVDVETSEITEGAAGENVTNKTLADRQKLDRRDSLVIKRDLEVDVHVDSLNTVQERNNIGDEATLKKKAKKSSEKRQHRHRSKPGEKAVAFDDASAQTGKKLNVGRCISLPSASVDTDDDDDISSGSNSCLDSPGDTTETSDENEKELGSGPKLRPRARPVRRRAVRGFQKHPWHNKPEMRPKTRLDNNVDLPTGSSSASSGGSDDWSKAAGKNNAEISLDAKSASAGASGRSRKRVPEAGSNLSPQRKLPALEITDEPSCEQLPEGAPIVTASMQATPERENDGDHQNSDQELLARNPVWRARRSPRYSSYPRLFFHRRSYTINSSRPREQDGRRRVSTVPPYNGRRISPPRRTPSSLQKLLRLWNSPGSRQGGDHSPGQVSPGEVVLTGHSVDETEFRPFSDDILLPAGDVADNIQFKGSSDRLTKLDNVSKEGETSAQKSDSGSHNSNPHCNEFLGSNTSKGEAGDNSLSSELVDLNSSTEVKPKKQKPKRSKLEISKFRDAEGLSLLNAPKKARTKLRMLADSATEEEQEEDMKKFVQSLIGAQETWRRTGPTPGISSVTNPGTGAIMHLFNRRSAPHENSLIDGDHDMAMTAEELIAARDALEEEFIATQEAFTTRRPRHSFPVSPEQGPISHRPLQFRSSVPASSGARSSGGRRVRHPAGNGASHPHLASKASENGVASSTLSQLSAGNVTDTMEMSGTKEMHELPAEVVQKMEEAADGAGVHIAMTYDDTSVGAMHTFYDEHGNLRTYTFGETSIGDARMLTGGTGPSSRRSSRARSRLRTHSSVQSEDTSDEAKSPPTSRTEQRIILQSFRRFNRQHRAGASVDVPTFHESDRSESFTQTDWNEISPMDYILRNVPALRPETPRVKLFYNFKILPFKSVTLQYNRLALLDLLDRNRFVFENIFATVLALIVAVLGLVLLQKGLFQDIWPLWFCIVIATAQYSLVRSVQPDSASPTHGHNRVIAYSRPVYFCILALLILLFDFLASDSVNVPPSYIYAGIYFTKQSCLFARSVLIVFIMLLPFVFLLGLLPQLNTFLMYLAEQVEIHMFGGSACTGPVSALFSLSRSILFCLLLFGFCYGGMSTTHGSEHKLFSVFCGLLISFSFHLSRQTNDPLHLWNILRARFFSQTGPAENAEVENGTDETKEDNPDELSSIYVQTTLSERLQSDLIVCPMIAVIMFAIHCSTAFTVMQTTLSLVLYIIAGTVGFAIHYILPQLRKQLPWLVFSSPLLKSKEYDLFEVQEEAKVMWFEKVYAWTCFFEKNVLYPLVIMNELTRDASRVVELYGTIWGSFILVFIGLKLLRSAYCVTFLQYAILVFSALYSKYDTRNNANDDPTVITYFLVSILFIKLQDLLLKLQFVFVYIAPWQITWGSAFHAFAQPFSVPHSGMMLLQTTISSLFHTPLAPFLGSAVFMTSYARPLKFWERNYNTKRVDHSNTRLASQIDRGPSTDDNNLNSIFYEHLTLSLQKSLCGDISMGRWGNVHPGDCFIMTSDYLNALVHVIQKGNGVITFQLRGLEFSGTYCQQREVEAISESVKDRKCCCCSPGHPKNMLSFNAAFNQRWLAWQVHTTKFVLDGYSITDNSATSMLGVYDLRKILLSYMVKSVIYFLTAHESLEKWLSDESILEAITKCETPEYVDIDTSFSVTIHDDYDMWLSGISRTKFLAVYGTWIKHCASRRENSFDADTESKLVTLCYMISVLSRRALGAASTNLTSHIVLESFLFGLHSLFKGDFRIASSKDEWVFNDMDLLHHVVAPGVRMSLKLHQDHFQNMDDEDDLDAMYNMIKENIESMVITHEADPRWRRAVLSNRSSLLALRHITGDAVDSYFVITLKRLPQGFRVVRVNKECVKGLWAGQQQELVFLRNSNPERGSIQNAKQVLRNMINSSCDQPIGYPIYVSPVTTSFANTHSQYKGIVGGSISMQRIRSVLSRMWACIQQSCGGGCNSGGSAGIVLPTVHGGLRRTPAPSLSTTQAPPTAVRTSVTGSQSSGTQSNAPEGTEQMSVNRMTRAPPHRSVSHDSRRGGRSILEEFASGSGSVFVSSASLSGRSSSRWRVGPDGSKRHSNRHPSGTGSVEMAPVNAKYHVQPSLSLRTSRNSRREGVETSANCNITLPTDESKPPQSDAVTGKDSHKSGNALPAPSSSSSSMSQGDSLTVLTTPPSLSSKPATRKSSGDGADVEKKVSGRLSSVSKGDLNQRRTGQKQQRKQSTEKEMLRITDPGRVLETLEVHRRTDHVKWPNDEWRKRGGRSKWGDWRPKKDMIGEAVFRWHPNHRNPNLRAHIGEVIVLLQIQEPGSKELFYVPIPEKCTAPSQVDIETTQL